MAEAAYTPRLKRQYDEVVRAKLTEQFGYTEQGAREMCIYVVDNDLAEAFED